MSEIPNSHDKDGAPNAATEGDAHALVAEDLPRRGHFDRAAVEQRLRSHLAPGHRVDWVRMSDLISAGTGRIAGQGIDFEAELARRLRHPAEVTRRALRNRTSSLPPLHAFGRSRSSHGRETLERS